VADIDAGFAKLVREKVQALFVLSDGFLTLQRQQIIALPARYAAPAIYPLREFAADGGLVSYGSSSRGAYRQSGI
jgi:putative ABC transport system substrate-binding protein